MSSFSGKVSNIGIPLVKKTQFLSLLPVSRRFTHYPSWLHNLVAYLVGTWAQEEILPWADSKAEMNIAMLQPALAAVNNSRWREIMARIQCPILLITGDPQLGAVVTPEAAQQAAQLWKQGEVVHLAGAGHNIRRDRYDEMMVAVKAFLNKA